MLEKEEKLEAGGVPGYKEKVVSPERDVGERQANEKAVPAEKPKTNIRFLFILIPIIIAALIAVALLKRKRNKKNAG